MSDDDDGKPAQVDRDHRTMRFSWTPAYEATFFRSLCESVQLGLRENSSFKAEAWERAAQALQESHGAVPTKSHLINKSDNARKRFRLWRGLREDPDFTYNSLTRTVSASEEAWRAHIEREPLSRALRGRPFDHEDYMEVLYHDVVGSGGAPKRIMKPRRRTDGTVADDSEMPGTGILNLLPESSLSRQTTDSPSQQRPPLSQTTSGSSTGSGGQQRPTSTTIPPRTATGSTSALTPPDEMVSHGRKRPLSVGASQQGSFETHLSPNVSAYSTSQPPPSPEKRRRISCAPNAVMESTGSTSTAAPAAASMLHARLDENQPLLDELLDLLRTRAAPRWREDALDLLFRDFADEELDLQLKISENVISSENKAMLFCKMPVLVRQHWVRRLREAYTRPS